MKAFNSTHFYLIVCYAHMEIFALYIRNINLIFIYYCLLLYQAMQRQKMFSIAYK